MSVTLARGGVTTRTVHVFGLKKSGQDMEDVATVRTGAPVAPQFASRFELTKAALDVRSDIRAFLERFK